MSAAVATVPDPAEPGAAGPAPRRPIPSLNVLMTIGALYVLVPGIGLFVLLWAVGVPTRFAGIAGLFAFIAGMALFPTTYLRRLDRVDRPEPPR